MRLAAVGFDHDPLLLPEEVDKQPFAVDVQPDVAVRPGEAKVEQVWEDERLEVTADIDGLAVLGPVGNQRQLE